MLKIHVLHRGGHAYYVQDLVPGRAEGTLLPGEAPGSWAGRGAHDLGLSGAVAGPDFAQLLAGRLPGSGRALRQDRPNGTAGFDLTFCAPKSVSILHLLAPAEVAAEVGAGHVAAVSDAMGYLERSAAGVRRQRDGKQARLDATGLAAGAFLHRTSRALDPHLHTHVVVANVAQGVDGSWSSLDSRRLFRHAPAAQAVYHARLRDELTDRLGVAWQLRPSGLADVLGVDPTLCRLFSGRTADMDEHLHRQAPWRPGARSPSRRIAALVTRLPKDRGRTVGDLVGEWRARALDIGFVPTELTRVVGLGRSVPATVGRDVGQVAEPHPSRARRRAADRGPDSELLGRRLRDLARHDRALSRRDLVAEVAAASPAGARSTLVESVAGRLVDGVPVAAGPTSTDDHGLPNRWLEPRWPAGNLVDRLADLSAAALSTEGPSDRAREGERARNRLDDRLGFTIERPREAPGPSRKTTDLLTHVSVRTGWGSPITTDRLPHDPNRRPPRAQEPSGPELGR